MKSQLIQCLLALLTLCALKMTAQVVPFTNIQQQVVFGIVQGSTPNNPNFYQWHPLSTTLQGVLIALEPTEVSTLVLGGKQLQTPVFQLSVDDLLRG